VGQVAIGAYATDRKECIGLDKTDRSAPKSQGGGGNLVAIDMALDIANPVCFRVPFRLRADSILAVLSSGVLKLPSFTLFFPLVMDADSRIQPPSSLLTALPFT